MRCIVFLIALCLALAAVAQDAPFSAEGAVLFDFEGEDALEKWSVRDLTDFALTQEWVARGKSAAAITYHEWAAGKQEWPAVIASEETGSLPITDWSRYDRLVFQAHNPNAEPAVVNLHLRDAAQKRFSRRYEIPAKSSQALEVEVRDIAAAIDAGNVGELHLYVTRPTSTYTLLVDDVRLVIDLLAPARELAKRAKALAAQVGTLAEAAGERAQRDAAAATSLSVRARRLASALEDRQFQSWDDLTQARRDVARLEEREVQVRGALPRLAGLAHAAGRDADAFVLAVESPMRKVFLEMGRLEPTFADGYRLFAARDEHESFQVVVVPVTGALSNVKWELSPLRNRVGAEIPAGVRLVGYVDCEQPSYKVAHTGWWPDPLIDFQTGVEQVPQNEVLPLWITVAVPEDAAAGQYRGTLVVTANNAKPQSVDIRLEVWDFALPKHTHLRTALSFRGMSAKLYPDRDVAALTAKYEDWMLEEYHLNPGSIYAGGPPSWDADRLRELMGMGLNAINLCYVYAPREPDFDEEKHWKRFEEQMAQVEAYLPVVEEAGARDLCYIYCFDERPAAQLDVVFQSAEKIKARWPDIEVMTTAYDQTFGLERENGAAMDIWVPLTPHFDGNAERVAEAREKGRDIWWYICIGPKNPHANWFVEYTAIEPRLIMGAMTAKYEPGGFLYYAVNRWPVNDKVITGGPRTDWDPASYKNNNGDGSIMCAGPDGPLATIRLENIRDGIEDYEYYVLLRELLAEKGGPAEPGDVPTEVVESLTTFTYDPAVVVAERERVAREILRLSR